jgi:hypothetical protein
MIRKVLGFVALAVLVAAPAAPQSVDDIIAKNVDAKGGLAKLKAVKSMRATGKMTIGPGIEAPIVLSRSGRSPRLDITVQG